MAACAFFARSVSICCGFSIKLTQFSTRVQSAAIQHIKESSSGAVIVCKNGVSLTCGDCNDVKMIVCGE